ncbi:calmin-like [Erpetoichthys calabaricus]|uniref:Calmin n=1 Tax=Erpetoichthys calabaricus TaxID=27687 RepID=A0A8C4XHM4_ERPCA|nr:calmin-like [Erpetoichthys calabaricus]
MAGHEWDDWFEREEFIGQISDIRVHNLQVEREIVQKRTFTRWMNLYLERCNPPLSVMDLFLDIQDGKILMALVEELSGCKLLQEYKPSLHRIFRLNNIAKVLNFLEKRNVKLVSIDAADIADGNPSIVLGLVWNIILFFQIKELTGNIKNKFSSSSSSLSSLQNSTDSESSYPSTPTEEKRLSVSIKDQRKAIKTLLQWVQKRTRKYGVAVQDFGKSWKSGLAFLAIIKAIDSSLVDVKEALCKPPRENLEDAFRIAKDSLGIPRLLEPEDVMINTPDEQSIMTYVSQFLEHFPELEDDEVSEVLQKSLSLVNPESAVDEQRMNGLSQNPERPYVVRNDWIPPPPKILISSMSDDIKQASFPTCQTPDEEHFHFWPSEDDTSGNIPITTELRNRSDLFLELEKQDPVPVCGAFSSETSICSAENSSDIDVEWNGIDQQQYGDSECSSNVSPLNELHMPYVEIEQCRTDDQVTNNSTSTKEPDNSVQFVTYKGHFKDSHDYEETYEMPNIMRNRLPSEEDEAYKYILELSTEKAVQDGSPEFCDEQDHPCIKDQNSTKDILISEQSTEDKIIVRQTASDVSTFSEESCTFTIKPLQSVESTGAIAREAHNDKEPITTPSGQASLNNINQDEIEGKTKSSSVSVIPLDLVYYPHYDVAISDVIKAFSEPTIDLNLPKDKNHNLTSDLASDVSANQNSKDDVQMMVHFNRVSSQDGSPGEEHNETMECEQYTEETAGAEQITSDLNWTSAQALMEVDPGASIVKSSSDEFELLESNRHVDNETLEEITYQSISLNDKANIKEDFQVSEKEYWGTQLSISKSNCAVDTLEEELHIKHEEMDLEYAENGSTSLLEHDDSEEHPKDIPEALESSLTESFPLHKEGYRKHLEFGDFKAPRNEVTEVLPEFDENIPGDIRWRPLNGQNSTEKERQYIEEPESGANSVSIYLLVFLWMLVYCIIIIPKVNFEALPFDL